MGDASPCRKKVGDAVPPRHRPTTPLPRSRAYHSGDGGASVWVEHDSLGGEMPGEHLLHLVDATARVLLHVPVVGVPAEDEPDVLRTVQPLLVCLQHQLASSSVSAEILGSTFQLLHLLLLLHSYLPLHLQNNNNNNNTRPYLQHTGSIL